MSGHDATASLEYVISDEDGFLSLEKIGVCKMYSRVAKIAVRKRLSMN